VADGGVAINYVKAEKVLREADGRAAGLLLRQTETDETARVCARAVINATGAWADGLRGQVGARSRIRPLRGSHLIFPGWRLPLAQAISFLHPLDQRPVFMFPWEGITLVGTTDVDHERPLGEEPSISPEEVAYLMAAISAQFPSRAITLDDVIASFAGVRPVIGSGKLDPSDESRDHVVWDEEGLITVTGGKLTTFRLIALDVLKLVRQRIPDLAAPDRDLPVLKRATDDLPEEIPLDEPSRQRILGRYGADARALVEVAPLAEFTCIPGTPLLWAELRWAARMEGVVHLDDLLLRRVRLGLLLPAGGHHLLPQIRAICQPELEWNDERWQKEEEAYLRLVRQCYGLPDRQEIPDWQSMLAAAEIERSKTDLRVHQRAELGIHIVAVTLFTTFVLAVWSLCKRARKRKGESS
jgi:glycerol-3-phosphate dehydrogenase